MRLVVAAIIVGVCAAVAWKVSLPLFIWLWSSPAYDWMTNFTNEAPFPFGVLVFVPFALVSVLVASLPTLIVYAVLDAWCMRNMYKKCDNDPKLDGKKPWPDGWAEPEGDERVLFGQKYKFRNKKD